MRNRNCEMGTRKCEVLIFPYISLLSSPVSFL
jgi:hypothetical protein